MPWRCALEVCPDDRLGCDGDGEHLDIMEMVMASCLVKVIGASRGADGNDHCGEDDADSSSPRRPPIIIPSFSGLSAFYSRSLGS